MSERFWFFLSISCLRCLARSIRLGETGTNALCFGFFLYEWVYRLPRRAAPGDGTGELADRFGYSHRIRALFPTRSLAMILMNGLKALANPTRLHVLELLKTPAAFDGPHGADGRPIGVTAKALLRKLRCTQPTPPRADAGAHRHRPRRVAKGRALRRLHARRGAHPAAQADDHRSAVAGRVILDRTRVARRLDHSA